MLCAPCIRGDTLIGGVAGAAVEKCPLASAGTILQGNRKDALMSAKMRGDEWLWTRIS